MEAYFATIAKAESELKRVEGALECVRNATKDLSTTEWQLSYINSRGCLTVENLSLSIKHPLGAAILKALEHHRDQLTAALGDTAQRR